MRPLILVLAIQLMPGSVEAVADAVHFAVTGHTEHDARCPEDSGPGPEHCCSGPFHKCSCCSTAPFVAVAQLAFAHPPSVLRDWLMTPISGARTGHRASIERPPAA